MSTTRLLIGATVVAAFGLALSGCASGETAGGPAASSSEPISVKVGATTPGDEILQFVEDSGQAEEEGIDIEVVPFTDYSTPNISLADGSTDANLYQHLPFLRAFNEENGTDIAPVGKVYFPPLALYSKKVGQLDELEDGSTISVPNDPTNALRSLQLLEAAGLITVKEGATEGVPSDVAENPHHFELQELDAATLPRALDDNPAGIVNLNFALPAGLTSDDQLFTEDVDGSPYANVLATAEDRVDDPAIQALYSVLTSEETQDWITEYFKGLVIPVSGPAD